MTAPIVVAGEALYDLIIRRTHSHPGSSRANRYAARRMPRMVVCRGLAR